MTTESVKLPAPPAGTIDIQAGDGVIIRFIPARGELPASININRRSADGNMQSLGSMEIEENNVSKVFITGVGRLLRDQFFPTDNGDGWDFDGESLSKVS